LIDIFYCRKRCQQCTETLYQQCLRRSESSNFKETISYIAFLYTFYLLSNVHSDDIGVPVRIRSEPCISCFRLE
jgi:hypothetical protein